MCIAVVKPKGVKPPSMQTLQNCWDRNSDGAGIMYTKDGKLHINKGFMTWDKFKGFYDKLVRLIDMDKELVGYHFRITTDGGTSPENCHPFPLSSVMDDLKVLKYSTDHRTVMHNGVISNYSSYSRTDKDSDTQKFIAKYLYHIDRGVYDWLDNKHLCTSVEEMLGSRLAVFNTDRTYKLLGEGWREVEGVWFSNGNYTKKKAYTSSYYNYSGYEHSYSSGYEKYEDYVDYEDYEGYKDQSTGLSLENSERLYLYYIEDAKRKVYKSNEGTLTEFEDPCIPTIDEDGNVYLYDLESSVFILRTDITVVDEDGIPYEFNDLQAVNEYVDCILSKVY